MKRKRGALIKTSICWADIVIEGIHRDGTHFVGQPVTVFTESDRQLALPSAHKAFALNTMPNTFTNRGKEWL